MKTHSTYETFESSSDENRRLLRKEELIVEVTEALTQALAESKMTKKALAEELGKTKGFVSQVLGGGRNLTIRTISDFADALQCRVRVQLIREAQELGCWKRLPNIGRVSATEHRSCSRLVSQPVAAAYSQDPIAA